MDQSSKNHHPSLGVNNKAIKKESTATAAHRSPLPRVYNIRRSDFRSVVQQLTGAASSALPRPRRLHQARPPPLSPVPRPSLPAPDPPVFPPPPAENPLSAYMRFLETSLLHSDGSHRPPPPSEQLNLQSLSPSALLDLLSPRCPPLSPGPLRMHPPLPLSPNIPFSPLPLQPLAPPSPGMLFPRSPSAFFACSPTWKDL